MVNAGMKDTAAATRQRKGVCIMDAVKFFLAAVCGVMMTGSVLAGPHGPPPPRHHGGSDGVVLATQIVDLVKSVIAPPTVVVRETAPVVVQQPAVVYEQPPVIYPQTTVIYSQPAPVVVRPAPYRPGPRHHPGPPPPPHRGRR